MEVASPLTFGHVKAGSKRRFACSPLDAPAAMDTTSAMDDSSAFHAQNFKRRRCGDTEMGNHNNNGGFAPFGTASTSPFASPFGQSQALSISTSIGNKRQRQAESPAERNTSQTTHLQGIIAKQLAEVQKLKTEKEEIHTSYQELSASHEKSQNENKLLKKVLAIKQERQDQFVSQLEDAHRYKEQSEQVIAMLRQHLHNQAQQSHGPSNGFTGGPSNVY